MKKIARIVNSLLVVILCAAALAGCNKTTTNYLTVDGKEVTVPYVLKINGNEVSIEEYRYYYMNIKYNYDNGEATYWTDNAEGEEQLKTDVLEELEFLYCANELSNEYNVELNSEELAEIETSLDESEASYDTSEEYIAYLQENYIPSEDFYKNTLLISNQLINKLYTDVFLGAGEQAPTEEQVLTYVQENYVRASHILIAFSDTEEATATKTRAEEVLVKVQNGDDFDALVAEYGEDPGMEDNSDGYYFTTGEMVEEFEVAAYSLAEGKISGLVETTYGYHIIKRLPLEVSYISANQENFASNYAYKNIMTVIEERQATAEIEYSEQYELIDTTTLS